MVGNPIDWAVVMGVAYLVNNVRMSINCREVISGPWSVSTVIRNKSKPNRGAINVEQLIAGNNTERRPINVAEGCLWVALVHFVTLLHSSDSMSIPGTVTKLIFVSS
jgi:hypothetical protein